MSTFKMEYTNLIARLDSMHLSQIDKWTTRQLTIDLFRKKMNQADKMLAMVQQKGLPDQLPEVSDASSKINLDLVNQAQQELDEEIMSACEKDLSPQVHTPAAMYQRKATPSRLLCA